MTPAEIIELARVHFGEETASSVSADSALKFLNEAQQELYQDLPPDRMKSLVQEASVATVDNQGVIVATWDKILDIYVDEIPAVQVSKEIIRNADRNLFGPPIPVWYRDEKYVWVRPSGDLLVIFLQSPDDLVTGDLETELDSFDKIFHPALADLVAAYMYAQEEDGVQAQHYRAEYVGKISSVTEQMAVQE